MSVTTQICERRFSFVEEIAESSHQAPKIALDEFDQMFEEFVRSWKLFRRDYDATIDRLLKGELRDTEIHGHGIQKTIEAGLKAASPLTIILAGLKTQGRNLEHGSEFEQARADLNALRKKVEKNWPFVDHAMVAESRAAFSRGETQTIEELLDALEGDRSEAG